MANKHLQKLRRIWIGANKSTLVVARGSTEVSFSSDDFPLRRSAKSLVFRCLSFFLGRDCFTTAIVAGVVDRLIRLPPDPCEVNTLDFFRLLVFFGVADAAAKFAVARLFTLSCRAETRFACLLLGSGTFGLGLAEGMVNSRTMDLELE